MLSETETRQNQAPFSHIFHIKRLSILILMLKFRWFQFATSPVMFSTLEDGKIVRGLAGVPDEGPVLLVGYHMLLGLELAPLILEFLREKNVIVRGIAHPALFTMNSNNGTINSNSGLQEFSYFDLMKVFGALPVTPSNFFKLFSSKSFALLYPGGAREALHRKVRFVYPKHILP